MVEQLPLVRRWRDRAPRPGTRVVLHIGLPKTGTTFVQRVLWSNRDVLAAAGWGVPGVHRHEHLEAAMNLRRSAPRPRSSTMADLRRQVSDHHGRWIVSEEAFGLLTRDQAVAAVEALGEHRVEIVVTVRDLAGLLPSAWQQRVKERRSETFDELLEAISSREDHRFWTRFDVVDVLERWIPAVGVENVTVIVLPQPGGGSLWDRFADRYGWPSDLPERTRPARNESLGNLWDRFADRYGWPSDLLERTRPTRNESLGVVEVEALRRVNAALAGRLPMEEPYLRAVREGVTRDLEQMRSRPDPIVVPERHRAWVDERTGSTIASLQHLGVEIVGDVEELVPVWPARSDDDEVTAPELVDVLVEVLIRTVDDRNRHCVLDKLLSVFRRLRR